MEPDNKIPPDVKKMSFEAALEELEGIVRTLEGGECDLDHAIIAYSRGALLKRHCEDKLKDAKSRIDKVLIDGDGNPSAVPFESK